MINNERINTMYSPISLVTSLEQYNFILKGDQKLGQLGQFIKTIKP